MFGIGGLELVVLLLVALLVVGPEQLPRMAVRIGRYVREFNRVRNELYRTVSLELDEFDLTRPTDARPARRSKEPPPAREPSSADSAEDNAAATDAPSPAQPLPPPPRRNDSSD
jgi:sec-independent protein translocase protein TatB